MGAELDLSSLRIAIAQFDEAMDLNRSDIAAANPRLAVHLRAAAIQAFEFTCELVVRALKRFLRAAEAIPAAADEMDFNELIRRGCELGLLKAEIDAWRGFRRDRGTTSHAYDEAKALAAFAAEAKSLLEKIGRRQGRAA